MARKQGPTFPETGSDVLSLRSDVLLLANMVK